MVLVGMGEDDAEDVVGVFLDKGRVGQDDFDARGGLVAEGDPHIDDDPLAIIRRSIAVAVEIHPDLIRAAQRQEDQFVVRIRRHDVGEVVLRRQTSKRPRMVRSLSKISMQFIEPSKSEATPPVATTVIGWPYSALMRVISPSIRPT